MAFKPSSSSATISASSTANYCVINLGAHVLVTNAGPNMAFVKFSTTSPVTAAISDLAILPFTQVLIDRNEDETTIGAICVSPSTASMYFMGGWETR